MGNATNFSWWKDDNLCFGLSVSGIVMSLALFGISAIKDSALAMVVGSFILAGIILLNYYRYTQRKTQ